MRGGRTKTTRSHRQSFPFRSEARLSERLVFMSGAWLGSSCTVLSACVGTASDYSKELIGNFEAEVEVIIFLYIIPYPAAVSSHNERSL